MVTLLLVACTAAPPGAVPVHRPPPTGFQRGPSGTPDATVDCAGGADFTSIQDAIDAAADATWIEVAPCTYPETIDYRGKTLWISSSGDAASTVLDANGASPAVEVDDGEGDATALVGFTIDDAGGTAVEVDLSALRLQDVIVTDSTGSYAVRSRSGDLELVDVTIDDSNDGWTASVYADKGAVSIKGGTLDCGSGDALFLGHGGFLIDGLTVSCSGFSDAIEIEHSVGRVQRSAVNGDVVVLAEEEHPDDLVHLQNTVVAGELEVEFGTFALRNSLVLGQATFTDVAETVAIESSVFVGGPCAIDSDVLFGPIRNNDFWGTTSICNGPSVVGSDGNLGVDPLFVDPLAGDYHLQAASPLVDAGVAELAYLDVDGSVNDIGVHGSRFSLDGGW